MFTRQELQTMASWLGKIQRFNEIQLLNENEDMYFISFDYYNPYWLTPVQIMLYKVVCGNPSLIVRAVHDNITTGIGEINALLNLIVKHKVNYDELTNSNWKSFCEEI